MEKLATASNFTRAVDLLRNTECSQKEKLNYFHQISECMVSPSVTSHANFAKHSASAIGVLLLFTEDLDSVVRMSAEENLNRIIRSLEPTRLSRILLDLYGEIRKNGNERSLRICLNLFSYYCYRIKEKNVKWYALKLLPCLQAIAGRRETLLVETLGEFIKAFSRNLQICLNDNETVKLIEVFLDQITADCAIKRRCSSQNCLNLIENSRNKGAMAKYGLNKALEFLINDQNTNTVLGVLGFLRLLLPTIIAESICDCKQIVEIYDVCLYLLSNQNHSIINASLEVINSMLSRRNEALEEMLTSHQLHREFLKKRKSLKNQIFQLKNSETTCSELAQAGVFGGGTPTLNKHQPARKSTSETVEDGFKSEPEEGKGVPMRFEASDSEEPSECNNFRSGKNTEHPFGHRNDGNSAASGAPQVDMENVEQFELVLEANEPQDDSHLAVEHLDDKLQVLSDIDNESFNSMDFDSEIAFGEKDNKVVMKSEREAELKSQKSTDSIGSFINSLISHSNAESMTKLFRPSAKLSGIATNSSSPSTPKIKVPANERSKVGLQSPPQQLSSAAPAIGPEPHPAASSHATETKAAEEDTMSLESINSHISLASHVSLRSSTQDLLRNEQNLVAEQSNDYELEKNVAILGNSASGVVSVTASNTILLKSLTEDDKTKNSFIGGDGYFNEKYKALVEDCRPELSVGTIYDQPIICYTVRLIASRFLLAGVTGSTIPDAVVRVSIKNLSLHVIANCVRLQPDVLGRPLEADRFELTQSPDEAAIEVSENSSNEFSEECALPNQKERANGRTMHDQGDDLLEMKDDHFGESNTTLLFNSPLSKSADPVLAKEIRSAAGGGLQQTDCTNLNEQLEKLLSKSEITETKRYPKQHSPKLVQLGSVPLAEIPPQLPPSEKRSTSDLAQIGLHQQKQFVFDTLLFHDHPDPILRGDVQIIVGNFISAATLMTYGGGIEQVAVDSLDFNRLLAMLTKGFRDEIHTVVIQALTSFDKVFPLLMSHYFARANLRRKISDNDDKDDEEQLLQMILHGGDNMGYKVLSPKFLLNQLRLCHENKYWLVQNKYAEVISNLSYESIREFYGDDIACSYENMFVYQLSELLGDEDFRVRENTADCLCRYIQRAQPEDTDVGSHRFNLNLLREFFDHRIFQGMSKSLRSFFNDATLPSETFEHRLSKVLYLTTNRLMELHEKNLQLGLINAIKVLLAKFNPVDYYNTWSEFNLAKVCLKFTFQNQNTAVDLNCQRNLIEITAKLLAADVLTGNGNSDFLQSFLGHIMKILNIYCHLFSNQKPVLFLKSPKTELFANTKEITTSINLGYFGNDYLYIRLYNTLKGAFESYKITINQESGAKLMSLVTTCLDALSLLLELQEHSKSLNVIKLIEEILQYLSVLINYEPVETVGCLRQLLKFLFGRNYVNRRNDHDNFAKLYFAARRGHALKQENGESEYDLDGFLTFRELFLTAMTFPLGKIKSEEDCVKHIKLFEPLVIYCLTLFMKSNAVVQAPILELLIQLLEFNVTYSILDSKNVIFDNVMKNLELIESGIARNSTAILGSVVKFLVNLTRQNSGKLVSIPKVISIINNLLANSSIRECSVLALKVLSFEIFFCSSSSSHPDYGSNTSLHAKELSTQKEVMLGMLEKFIGYGECQKTLSILLLWNKAQADVPSIQEDAVYAMVVRGLEEGKIKVHNLHSFFLLESLFANCDKNILLETKGFSSLLSLLMAKNADNFNNLSSVTIILEKVIQHSKEIYLTNHDELDVKNYQSTRAADKINYFIKVLYGKLDTCFSTLIKCGLDTDFYWLVVKFIRILWKVSRKVGINHNFRQELMENFVYGKHAPTILRMECLQVEFLKELCVMNSDKILILLQLQKVDSRGVQFSLLKEICTKFSDPGAWKTSEVELLLSEDFLSVLMEERYKFLRELCNTPAHGNVVVRSFLDNIALIQIEQVPFVVKLVENIPGDLIKLQLLSKLLEKVKRKRAMATLLESAIRQEFLKNPNIAQIEGVNKILSHLNGKSFLKSRVENEVIDEKWMVEQVIQLSSTIHPEEYVRILLNIKSETKMKSMFGSTNFNMNNVLKSCIDISFQAMMMSFQKECIQHNSHINYLNMNLLAKMSVAALLTELQRITALNPNSISSDDNDISLISAALTTLFENVEKLRSIGLLYVESKFIEKFVKEQILRPSVCNEILIKFLLLCCNYIKQISRGHSHLHKSRWITGLYKCMESILRQESIWTEINQSEEYAPHLSIILDMVHDGMTKSIRNTIFYEKHKMQIDGFRGDGSACGGAEDVEIIQKAIFIAKLIETKIDIDSSDGISSMRILRSIAIALLRMDQFYVYAVTPLEVFQTSGGCDRHFKSTSKLPSIPVELLADVDILQKFVKRLSIFGFSARQQFEEYFMTFLLLINKTYDENMVDVLEQHQIKSTCLQAILELLITCRTFPTVGNALSRCHHTTRFSRIKCDSISSKKLHKIQLLVPGTNVFWQPSSERDLRDICSENCIGTSSYLPNQYGLNFLWYLMENTMTEEDAACDIQTKNIRYFSEQSGVDLKSSIQLIYDILSDLLEQNHVLVLPSLAKFCEICENRDQIRGIKQKILRLQEIVAVDDTISHQYIIYILCKTQSILVPSQSELSYLCSIISTYLKSSHVFIRNATLHGLLSLLECCSKTSTTIGKLSEELSMLRELIVDYVTRHGIIEESSLPFSDVHAKLVWTLNFSLIETTAKFVPECNLLSNSIISANNLLKRTPNENIYLCVLHGIERIILINGPPQPICDKIEKLSVELVKLENERFCLPALKLLLTCIYTGSSTQLRNTELSNGIVQDDPEIIAQQTEKVDVLLHCIKSSTSSAAKIYGQVLCQIIRDLVPPNEILTKVIKEFLSINQPHCEVIAQIVHQVFRSAIDSSFLQMLQDWLICSLPTFVMLPENKGVWSLTVIFLSASINLHLIKFFPIVLYDFCKLSESEVSLFLTSAHDFYERLNMEQKARFKEVFSQSEINTYKLMLREL